MAPKVKRVGGQWRGKSAGGCLNHTTWRFNPQLFLSVDKKRTVRITLHQEDTNFHIGFYLALSDGSGRRQIILHKPSLVGRVSFEDEPSVEEQFTLKSGRTYVLIPCTFMPCQEGRFTIDFQYSGSLTIQPLPPDKEWKWVTAKDEWRGKSAGGCRNHLTCINNPQFLIRTRKATTCTILLSQVDTENVEAIGFYVFPAKSTTYKLSKFRHDPVAKSDFVRAPEASATLELTARGKYVIIPCTFDQGSEGRFAVTVFSGTNVKLRPLQDAKEVAITSEWKDNEAGGCINNPTWRENPQFFLLMKQRAKVSITLEQYDPVCKSIGFYVTKGNGSQVVALPPDDLIAKASFKKQRAVTEVCSLPVSETPHVIIPCTFHPNIRQKFRLSVCVLRAESTSRVRAKDVLQLLPCNSEWRNKSFKGFWTEGYCGGCINEKRTWLQNPQFVLSITGASKVAIVLTQELPENVIGFYLLRTDSPDYLTQVSSSSDVRGSQFPKGSHEATLQLDLEAGTYNIVCCTFEPNRTGHFELTVHAENDEMDLELVPAGGRESFVRRRYQPLRNFGAIQSHEIIWGEKIGQGGFGMVYKALWRDQMVAVKRLFCDDMRDKEYENFQMEIELMSMLQHKNILTFIGGVLETKSFLVTEYMERGNLSDVLRKEPDLPWTRKILMAIDAAEGICYLHEQDPVIVHRDLKSLNLLVSKDYTVKVADFGLSKATSGRSLNSKVGSINWCAPEILRKRMPYTPKSDVFSFGMVLYEFITHEPPFKGLNPLQIVSAIGSEDYPALPPATPEELVQLTEDCWKTEPEDRPDFEDIVKRLHQIKTLFQEDPSRCRARSSIEEIQDGSSENSEEEGPIMESEMVGDLLRTDL